MEMKSNSSPVWTLGVASEFPPDLISSGEDSYSSETDTEDLDSSKNGYIGFGFVRNRHGELRLVYYQYGGFGVVRR